MSPRSSALSSRADPDRLTLTKAEQRVVAAQCMGLIKQRGDQCFVGEIDVTKIVDALVQRDPGIGWLVFFWGSGEPPPYD